MNDFFKLVDKLREELINTEFIKTVTFGDITQIANNKRDVYPIGHVMINNSTILASTTQFNVSIFAMDVVDVSINQTIDKYKGNNNLHEILQEMHSVLNRIQKSMRSGDLYDLNIQLVGDPTLEPFTDRFEDVVAGWVMDIDVELPNEISKC